MKTKKQIKLVLGTHSYKQRYFLEVIKYYEKGYEVSSNDLVRAQRYLLCFQQLILKGKIQLKNNIICKK